MSQTLSVMQTLACPEPRTDPYLPWFSGISRGPGSGWEILCCLCWSAMGGVLKKAVTAKAGDGLGGCWLLVLMNLQRCHAYVNWAPSRRRELTLGLEVGRTFPCCHVAGKTQGHLGFPLATGGLQNRNNLVLQTLGYDGAASALL